MKLTFISVLSAVSTMLVAGFVPSSPVAWRGIGLASKESQSCLKLLKKQATDDLDLEVFVEDMALASTFVYLFRNIRDIVRDRGVTVGDGKECRSGRDECEDEEEKKSFFQRLFPKKEVEFYRPELIITDKGAQQKNGNRYFNYAVTPAAIKLFIENNRKFFKEEGADLEFDETEKTKPFKFEGALDEAIKDNMKIIDYDDAFSTDKGGLVYGLVVNLTNKWVCVVFRGTVGLSDIMTDRDFRLNDEFFFSDKYGSPTLGGNPGTHAGFTKYLASERECDSSDRPLIDRIIASVDDVFEKNVDVKGKGFKLYITGHSLGGGLANLFAYHTANLKARGDRSVKHLPQTIKAMTFAAPVVGNDDFNKEYQELEKKGVLRHVRVANQGDVVPTNNIPFPLSLALKGSSKVFTQNGVNLFLRPRKELDAEYRNTKSCLPELLYGNLKVLDNHMLAEYMARLKLEKNQESFKQTVEELYEEAGDFTE